MKVNPNFASFASLWTRNTRIRSPTIVLSSHLINAAIALHILFMKSSEKALKKNSNASELELFCHNRFYGPLIVAQNFNKHPYSLANFGLKDLKNIAVMNKNFQNKSKTFSSWKNLGIKDDNVPNCLLSFELFN